MQLEVTTRLLKLLFLAFILILTGRPEDARACPDGGLRINFPTCEISAPRPSERTSVIYVYSGNALSSVTPGSDGIVTEVVDIEIGVAEKPHYIVLSSGKPIIWRFTGRIEDVSRVLVLGSQINGATRTGVVGVPRDRVVFAKTDMTTLPPSGVTTSDISSSACESSTYFDIPKADRMCLAGEAPAVRYDVAQFVEQRRAGVIAVPQGSSGESVGHGSSKQGASGGQSSSGRGEMFGVMDYVATSQNYERGLIKVDAGAVVSQETVRDNSVLPAAAGIRQLLAEGSLVKPDDPRFRAAYDKWIDRFSQRYRSRLDPDFLLPYKVDYLATRPIVLPAGLDRTTFLVGEGVESPDMNGNSLLACLYYADLREIQADPREIGTVVEGFSDPRCSGRFRSSWVLSEADRSMVDAERSVEQMQKATQAEKDKCRSFEVTGDAYFAGIAVSKKAVPSRRLDVIVNRPGKVALYLERSDGADWHIRPSAQTQITNVVLGWGSTVNGLDQSVPTHMARTTRDGCFRFDLVFGNAYLGGPAALALDQSLQVLAGRGLDVLLRKANDGGQPAVVDDPNAPPMTVMVE